MEEGEDFLKWKSLKADRGEILGFRSKEDLFHNLPLHVSQRLSDKSQGTRSVS